MSCSARPDPSDSPSPAPREAAAAPTQVTRDDPRYWCADPGGHRPGCACAWPEDHSADGLYLEGPHARAGTLGRHVPSIPSPAIVPSPAVAHAQQQLARDRATRLQADRELTATEAQARAMERLRKAISGQFTPARRRRG